MNTWSKPLATATFVAAIALSGGASAAPLTFWNGFTGPDRPAVESITAAFSKANPDTPVTMDIMPWDSLMQKLLTSLASGSGPDVIAINFANLPQFAKSGYVLDLTPYVNAEHDLDPANWAPALKSVLQYDGHYYATPMNYATLLMYYNKDLFKAAGLDPNSPPKTWDEWVKAIRATTRTTGDVQYGTVLPDNQTIPNWPILLWGNGADIIKNGKGALSAPESIKALALWSDLVLKEKISPAGLTGAEADKLFETGKAAMEVTGPWMTSGYTAAKLNFDVAPVPAGPAGPATVADSVVMLVNKATKNKDAAIKLLSHWNSKAVQLAFANATGFPPSRTDLASSPDLTNPWAAKFAAVVPSSRFSLAGQLNYMQINDEVFVPLIQSITMGKVPVAKAAAAADAQLVDLAQ